MSFKSPSISRNSKPELLSPAGDWESLQAAVLNGADAVYLGSREFNARVHAKNFTPDELSTLGKEAELKSVTVEEHFPSRLVLSAEP